MMLQYNLLPFIIVKEDKVIFLQDNVLIHIASSSKSDFEEFEFELLPCTVLTKFIYKYSYRESYD